MTRHLRSASVLLVLSAAVACGEGGSAREAGEGPGASGAGPGQAAPPPSAPSNSGAAAGPASAPVAAVGPISEAEVRAYRLEMEKVRLWAQAGRNVREVVDAHPELQKEVPRDQPLTDAMSEQLRDPRIAGAVQRAGISPRDFVMISAKLPLAYAAHDLRERNPAMAERLAAPGALEFVRENQEELRRIFQELEIIRGQAQDGGR